MADEARENSTALGGELLFSQSMEDKINIRKLIASKNPGLLRWMPGFVLRYLEKILHQREINQFLRDHDHLHDEDFCDAIMAFLQIKVVIRNPENLPKEGKLTFVMNHPLGGLDAVALVSGLRTHKTGLKFIVNDLLLFLGNLNGLFLGVNKHGKNSLSKREQIDQLFASEHVVCIFPAGLVSRKINGVIQDLPWKKTFITLSKKHQRTLVPILIEGNLSAFFYRLANLRKRVGIKANLEMLYLSDELFKLRGKTIYFNIGAPIASTELTDRQSDKDWADFVRQQLYSIREQV